MKKSTTFIKIASQKAGYFSRQTTVSTITFCVLNWHFALPFTRWILKFGINEWQKYRKMSVLLLGSQYRCWIFSWRHRKISRYINRSISHLNFSFIINLLKWKLSIKSTRMKFIVLIFAVVQVWRQNFYRLKYVWYPNF